MNMFVRISLILGLFVFLTSCFSGDIAQSEENKTPSSSSSNRLNTSGKNANSNSPIKVLGAFSNYGSNGEHEWGWVIRIWKQDKNLVGLISGSIDSRIVGDAPIGILEDVVYEADTGKISFRASLPSFDYEFQGALSQKKLEGKIFNSRSEKTEKVILLKSTEMSSEMSDFQSYNEWKSFADRLLKLRGANR